MSEKNIAWPGEAKKYADQPNYDLSEIVPPPNWRARYPDGYTESNPPPNLKENEHFQNWMRTAGLPTFTKLYSRNDVDTLSRGTYQIVVDMSPFLYAYSSGHVTHTRYRLPRQIIQGYEIHCHLNGFLDRWKEPFPWMGLRRCCCCLCAVGRPGDHQASRPTKVRSGDSSFLDFLTHDHRVTGDWETCHCCRGIGERGQIPRSVYQTLYLSLYHACPRSDSFIL